MGYRYGYRYGICVIDMGYGIWYIDMVIYHSDIVILDIKIGCGLMMWEMTVSIWSSPISMWDILSLSTTLPGAVRGVGLRVSVRREVRPPKTVLEPVRVPQRCLHREVGAYTRSSFSST